MCESKPMLHEKIAQLERSLLCEIAAHDKTKRRLAAQEREIERMRSNMYKNRVQAAQPSVCVGDGCSVLLEPYSTLYTG